MSDDKLMMSSGDIGRWLVVALVIIAGIVLFFVFGPSTSPAITPTVGDILP